MELRQYLEFCRRRWWLLVLLPLLAGLAAFYGSKQLTPIYEGTTTVLVNQTQAPGVIQYNDILTSERLTTTYAELAKRRPILTEVRRRLGLAMNEDGLRARLIVAPIRNTQLLRISMHDPDPERAANIANTTALAFIEDNASQLGSRPGTVSIAEQASVPSFPVSPNVRLNIMIAAVCGLLLGVGLAIALEYLDDTVKTSRDVEVLGALTTLGNVTRFHGVKSDGSESDMLTMEPAEDYRQIRTNVHFSLLGPGPKSILVTSMNPGEGKSTTAASLAIVLAQAGHSVILIDTDLRRPSLNRRFGCSNSFGLTGLLLRGAESPVSALMNTPLKGLWLLPSGPLPANPSELLMSTQLWTIVEAARSYADYVIFDSPPLLPVTDATILAAHADATILVVEAGRTRSEAFQRGLEAMRQANARVIGVVLNKVKRRQRGPYYNSYYRKEASMEPAAETATTIPMGLKRRPPAVGAESETRTA